MGTWRIHHLHQLKLSFEQSIVPEKQAPTKKSEEYEPVNGNDGETISRSFSPAFIQCFHNWNWNTKTLADFVFVDRFENVRFSRKYTCSLESVCECSVIAHRKTYKRIVWWSRYVKQQSYRKQCTMTATAAAVTAIMNTPMAYGSMFEWTVREWKKSNGKLRSVKGRRTASLW